MLSAFLNALSKNDRCIEEYLFQSRLSKSSQWEERCNRCQRRRLQSETPSGDGSTVALSVSITMPKTTVEIGSVGKTAIYNFVCTPWFGGGDANMPITINGNINP